MKYMMIFAAVFLLWVFGTTAIIRNKKIVRANWKVGFPSFSIEGRDAEPSKTLVTDDGQEG